MEHFQCSLVNPSERGCVHLFVHVQPCPSKSPSNTQSVTPSVLPSILPTAAPTFQRFLSKDELENTIDEAIVSGDWESSPYGPVTTWDVSAITDFSGAFACCPAFAYAYYVHILEQGKRDAVPGICSTPGIDSAVRLSEGALLLAVFTRWRRKSWMWLYIDNHHEIEKLLVCSVLVS
jgi:hypothetical protein